MHFVLNMNSHTNTQAWQRYQLNTTDFINSQHNALVDLNAIYTTCEELRWSSHIFQYKTNVNERENVAISFRGLSFDWIFSRQLCSYGWMLSIQFWLASVGKGGWSLAKAQWDVLRYVFYRHALWSDEYLLGCTWLHQGLSGDWNEFSLIDFRKHSINTSVQFTVEILLTLQRPWSIDYGDACRVWKHRIELWFLLYFQSDHCLRSDRVEQSSIEEREW